MSNSTRLALPYIDAAQSQKHVTHNEALVALDALVHLSVKSRTTIAPPGSPSEGDRYLVPSGATGIFAGHTNAIATFDDGGWAWLVPKAGWRAYVESEALFLIFDGAAWKDAGLSLQSLQNLSRLGVGATADATNPVLAKLNSALFTARASGEGGTGDLRITLNKSAAANTVSQLYQNNYSGRAETGLTGDDRYRIKVSADGATWREALNVDPATGLVALPQTAGLANGLATLDATGKVPSAQLPAATGSILRSYLAGFGLANNAAAPATKIDVAAGAATDSANAAMISCAAVTINCAVTGANGLDAGALAANAWYHIFAIAKPDGTAACLASLSVGAPSLPAGYSTFRRIGAIRTDGSAAILAFTQIEDTFRFAAAITDVSTANMGTGNALYTLSVPSGLRVRPIADVGTTAGNLLLFNGDEAGYAPPSASISTAPGWTVYGAFNMAAHIQGHLHEHFGADPRARGCDGASPLHLHTRLDRYTREAELMAHVQCDERGAVVGLFANPQVGCPSRLPMTIHGCPHSRRANRAARGERMPAPHLHGRFAELPDEHDGLDRERHGERGRQGRFRRRARLGAGDARGLRNADRQGRCVLCRRRALAVLPAGRRGARRAFLTFAFIHHTVC